MEIKFKVMNSASHLCWTFALLFLIRLGCAESLHMRVATQQESKVVDCFNTKRVPFLTTSNKTYHDYSTSYNLRLQYKPVAIALAVNSQHVADAILCAAKSSLKVQARSGGHSYASYSTGGKNGAVVIDLQKFQAVSFDTTSNITTFGAGVRLGNLDLALRQYGRAVPHGTCAGVGAGGHFTTGGDGIAARAHGLAIDSLVAMDVVLANGSLVHATAESYPDVFFAMKGAGSSFGIATTFYAQTFAYPKVVTGIYLTWPDTIGKSADLSFSALRHFQNFANNASSGIDRNLQFDITVDVFGSFILKGVYLGPAATFNKTVLPELTRGLPASAAADGDSPAFIKEYSWTEALYDANYGGVLHFPRPGDRDFVPVPDHDNFYAKSVVVPAPGLPGRALRNLVAWSRAHVQAKKPAVDWYYTLSLQGGYDNQIFLASRQGEAAFWRRDSVWIMEMAGFPGNLDNKYPVPAGIDLVDELSRQVTDVLGKGGYGAYQGYVDPELSADEAGRLYYGDQIFEKLKGLKRKLDPRNIFSNPQSIPVGG